MEQKVYTTAEVALRNGKDGNRAWIIVKEIVYDVTEYLQEHPGGADLLLEAAGKDASRDFADVGHSADARKKMDTFKIGRLDSLERKIAKEAEANGVDQTIKNRSFLSLITCGLF